MPALLLKFLQSTINSCAQWPRRINIIHIWGLFRSLPKNYCGDFFTAQKWSFPLRISSVNVTKSAENCGLVTLTEEILNGKLHFLCSVKVTCWFACVSENAIRTLFKLLCKWLHSIAGCVKRFSFLNGFCNAVFLEQLSRLVFFTT